MPHDVLDHLALLVRRHGHVDDFDLAIGQQQLVVGIDARNLMSRGDLAGVLDPGRRNRHRIEACGAIGH